MGAASEVAIFARARAISGYTPAALRVVDRLARNELFSHFAPEKLAQLCEGVEELRVPADTFVLRQGEPTQDAYIIERGGIRIQRTTPYGQYAIAILARGELFGEASFVDAVARSGDAYTTSTTELLVFRAAQLFPRLEADPLLATALYWTFWRSLSLKLRRTNEKLGRFFAEGAVIPPSVEETQRSPTGEFRVDLRTKRDLFTQQKLSPLEISLLSSLSRERRLAPGALLFREGDPGDAMYIVLEGRVRISKQIPGVGEEALAILERGDYFGEMALIDRQPRSAEAKAHDAEGAVVLRIPQEVVDGLLDIRKVSAVGLLRILCGLLSKRLREIDDKLVTWYILAGGNVPEIR
jgi:CRP/FNR family transcriptional regulator, cyclic AMP receptor protein